MTNEQFFVITTPGLEDLAERELRQFLKNGLSVYGFSTPQKVSIQKSSGGLELELPPDVGWLLNLHLKVPSRILQRVLEFPARDFPKVYNRLRKWPWQKYLRQGDVEVKASSRASRLKMKDKLEETVREALADATQHQAFRKAFLETPQGVFIRVQNDVATVSLDTSGKPLFQRGYKTKTVSAPMRETLAAALFRLALETMPRSPDQVVDPMCGSGTLIFEALSHTLPIRSRQFAFENFPCATDTQRWKPIKRWDSDLKMEGFGQDQENKAMEAAQANGMTFQKKFSKTVQWNLPNKKSSEALTLMMINPPYDERLSADRFTVQGDIAEYIRKVSPNFLAIVWPGTEAPHLDGLVDWKSRVLTRNGGLAVNLSVGQVRL